MANWGGLRFSPFFLSNSCARARARNDDVYIQPTDGPNSINRQTTDRKKERKKERKKKTRPRKNKVTIALSNAQQQRQQHRSETCHRGRKSRMNEIAVAIFSFSSPAVYTLLRLFSRRGRRRSGRVCAVCINKLLLS